VQPELVVVVTSVLPAAVVAARLEKVPTVVYAAEILRGERFRNAPRAVAAGLLRSVVARADAVICCSQAVAAQFSRRPTTIVQVIYPGVGSGFDAGNRNAFREAHALRDADPCLAVVGNLTQGRGQDLVLKALPSLRHIFPHVRLMVAGPTLPRAPDMRYERALKQLADELGVSEAVAFVGPTDRVADVYAASDIVVNPVRVEEALGRVALEALAAGRPVIATRRGAIPEVLRDGQDALLIDAEDPAAIAAAVRTLWADRALRERLVRTGRSRVAIEFDVKRSVDKFTTLIDEVLLHARFHARSSTSPNKSE
jgi:glycosyltransferase involved in cell wall biosynthesis